MSSLAGVEVSSSTNLAPLNVRVPCSEKRPGAKYVSSQWAGQGGDRRGHTPTDQTEAPVLNGVWTAGNVLRDAD
ncbi:hypothetical protein GGTG_02823 [Gaeumannomyces tritici R3-111a-1]|uniref:Uncharacterized protein n=1 Tax=Gaeumannomyces tritici (strain R3-111a-1) TaxID=644352 RepID=J3NNG7_GAET3|nr:hypothetical protein GGTG_02823 [Gaeumannomyces tritici R3-111a-1]EJT77718.1 hypothetical protein GGTG_02823 [Gaeumannomyces tritici R3-111a-1]